MFRNSCESLIPAKSIEFSGGSRHTIKFGEAFDINNESKSNPIPLIHPEVFTISGVEGFVEV